MKSFTSVRGLGRSDLEALISRASELRDAMEKGTPVEQVLRGMCVANMFFEPSTRTRLSFDLAAQRLGANVVTFDPERSSTSKGESLRDTALTVAAIGADILVVRHREVGAPQSVGDWTGLPVINAGDGVSEHPTQALLDAVTLQRHFGRLEGLQMAIVGDIAHSRVAGSLIHAMPVLGVDLTLVAPERWMPDEPPVPATTVLDDLLEDVDVLYLLRVQTERGGVVDSGYVADFGLDEKRVSRLGPGAVVMHPGPINRGVEISDEAAESPRSLITEQVRNGVPTRMAVLDALAGEGP
jgi:aspartate carbamoyltransferase catalytic subunit